MSLHPCMCADKLLSKTFIINHWDGVLNCENIAKIVKVKLNGIHYVNEGCHYVQYRNMSMCVFSAHVYVHVYEHFCATADKSNTERVDICVFLFCLLWVFFNFWSHCEKLQKLKEYFDIVGVHLFAFLLRWEVYLHKYLAILYLETTLRVISQLWLRVSLFVVVCVPLMHLIYQTSAAQPLHSVRAPSGLILLFIYPLPSRSAYCEEQSRWACIRPSNRSSVVGCGAFPVRRTTSMRT